MYKMYTAYIKKRDAFRKNGRTNSYCDYIGTPIKKIEKSSILRSGGGGGCDFR